MPLRPRLTRSRFWDRDPSALMANPSPVVPCMYSYTKNHKSQPAPRASSSHVISNLILISAHLHNIHFAHPPCKTFHPSHLLLYSSCSVPRATHHFELFSSSLRVDITWLPVLCETKYGLCRLTCMTKADGSARQHTVWPPISATLLMY
jgi:hypothetical protein